MPIELCVNMSNGKFEVFVSSRNLQYYFRLKSGNGEIILSSEGYVSKQGCLSGIASVKVTAPYESRYNRRDSYQNYTFNLTASNGEIVGRSENYVSFAGRENGIAAVKHEAPDARVVDLT